MTIHFIISFLQLSVSFVKVKAHNSNWLNDKADALAKEAVILVPRLVINYEKLSELWLFLTYDHLSIEASSKRTIKQLFCVRNFHQHLQLNRNE